MDTIFPKQQAPILVSREGDRMIEAARFGLIPKSTGEQKFPLTNATVEKMNRWPWMNFVGKSRCIVPIASFYEYSYYDEFAGHKLEFEPESMVFAAGLFSDYANTTSMAIITLPGNEFIMEHGHRFAVAVFPKLVDKEFIWSNGFVR